MNAFKRTKTHLGVYGIITEGDQILLIKKSRGPYTGLLDLPGGRLEHGEEIPGALRREIKEETGLVVSDVTLKDNFSVTVEYDDGGGLVSVFHVGLIYHATISEGSMIDPSIADEDSLGPVWWRASEIDPRTLSPFAHRVVGALAGWAGE